MGSGARSRLSLGRSNGGTSNGQPGVGTLEARTGTPFLKGPGNGSHPLCFLSYKTHPQDRNNLAWWEAKNPSWGALLMQLSEMRVRVQFSGIEAEGIPVLSAVSLSWSETGGPPGP